MKRLRMNQKNEPLEDVIIASQWPQREHLIFVKLFLLIIIVWLQVNGDGSLSQLLFLVVV